jgi:hypothetical protein
MNIVAISVGENATSAHWQIECSKALKRLPGFACLGKSASDEIQGQGSSPDPRRTTTVRYPRDGDIRSCFSRIGWMITPISGDGPKWTGTMPSPRRTLLGLRQSFSDPYRGEARPFGPFDLGFIRPQHWEAPGSVSSGSRAAGTFR